MTTRRPNMRSLPGDQGAAVCTACKGELRFSFDKIGRTLQSCRCGTRPLFIQGNRFGGDRDRRCKAELGSSAESLFTPHKEQQ